MPTELDLDPAALNLKLLEELERAQETRSGFESVL